MIRTAKTLKTDAIHESVLCERNVYFFSAKRSIWILKSGDLFHIDRIRAGIIPRTRLFGVHQSLQTLIGSDQVHTENGRVVHRLRSSSASVSDRCWPTAGTGIFV